MERSIGLTFTTLTIFAPRAHAAHPQQAVKPEGTASPFELAAPELPIAHSFGLDHEMLASDPMTYLGARDPDPAGSGTTGGCTAAGGLPSGAIALALAGLLRRRRRG